METNVRLRFREAIQFKTNSSWFGRRARLAGAIPCLPPSPRLSLSGRLSPCPTRCAYLSQEEFPLQAVGMAASAAAGAGTTLHRRDRLE